VLRPLRFLRLWLVLGGLLILGMLVVCLVPSVPGPNFPGVDKIEHLAAYLILTSWFAALVERRGYAAVAIAMIVFGIGIEFAQDAMALGRQGDWRDVVANSIGVGAGLLVAALSRESWLARVEKWLPAS
jgi:VanZ family protein